MDRILHEVAKVLLEALGARQVRILDGGVDADFGPLGDIRVDVRRVR